MLVNYKGKISFVIGEKDPLLVYVQQAQQSNKYAEINIILQKNHMQLFFTAKVITSLLHGLHNASHQDS